LCPSRSSIPLLVLRWYADVLSFNNTKRRRRRRHMLNVDMTRQHYSQTGLGDEHDDRNSGREGEREGEGGGEGEREREGMRERERLLCR
jgi:hypothetical protein